MSESFPSFETIAAGISPYAGGAGGERDDHRYAIIIPQIRHRVSTYHIVLYFGEISS